MADKSSAATPSAPEDALVIETAPRLGPDEPSLETMRSRIYDPVLYPSQPNLIGDLRADAMRLLLLLERAAYVAEHLFQMIDPQAWRDTGGDDGQGHYEGDYHAWNVREEIKSWTK